MATAEAAATETVNQVVGTVAILYGNVKALSIDGTERVLGPNSPIFSYDRVITESDGMLSILIDDPAQSQIDIGRMSHILIDEDIYAGVSAEDVAAAAAEVEQIQEALLAEGFDPTVELEAPAAGASPAAGGGHPVPDFARVTHEGEVVSGAETTGIITDTVDPIDGVVEAEVVDDNQPPVANDDSETTPEDTAVTIDLTSNDTDQDGTIDPTTVSIVTGPVNGTLVNNGDGTVTYIPNEDYNGPDSFTYTVQDDDGATSNVATVSIGVDDVNDPPEFLSGDDTTATPPNVDSYSFDVDEGTSAGTEIGTAPAFDIDGDSLFYTIESGNEDGLFSINSGTGEISLTKTIDDDNLGTYNLTIKVVDGQGGEDTAAVDINLNNINDPPEVSDLSARVSEEGLDNGIVDTAPDATLDTSDSTTASGQIVFSDPDASDAGNHIVTLGAPVESLASGGTPIFWTGSGSSNLVGYAGEDGPEVISITIDNAGNYNITLSAPIDHADATVEDVKSFGVTVTVTDPQGAEDAATLTIGIEDDEPVVSDTTGSVAEDDGDTNIITITPAAFGADGPAETDAVSVIDDVDQGTLTYDPDTGTFSYDPGDAFNDLGAGKTAEVSFTYQVTDADSDTDTATVTITINGDNDPPVINENPEVSDLSARVSEEGLDNGLADTHPDATLDTTDSTTASGQIVFSDPDAGDAGNHIVTLGAPVEPLTSGTTPIFWTGSGSSNLVGYAGEGGPEVISITIDNAGNYNITLSAPIDHAAFTVEDVKSFGVTVTVADPQGAEDTATLTIGIEDDKPEVIDATVSVSEDDGDTDIITITPARFGADGPAETDAVTVVDDVDQGTLTYDPDTGTFSYDPGDAFNDLGPGETGEVSFSYQVTDADDDAVLSVVTITINGDNDPPVINENPQVSDLSARVSEEGLDNGLADTAPDATLDTSDSTTASGQIVFSDPDAGDAGNHLVTLGAPVEPLASGTTPIFWTGSGSSNLVGYAGEGGPEVISITIDNAGNYNITLSAPIDHADATIEDVKSFGVTVTVADPQGAEDTAILTIGIEDDMPVVSDTTFSVAEDDGDTGIITITPAAFGADGPAETDTVTVIDDVDRGTLTYDPDTGTFSYDPGDAFNDLGPGETAEVSFTYQVTDADSDTDTATVTITVNGDNDPPVINENPEVSDLSARVSEEGLDNGLADTAPDATLDTSDSTTASGQIVFSDPDAGDAGNHIVTLGAPVEPLASGTTPIFWTGSGSSNLVGYAGEGGPEVINITIDNAGNYNVIFSAPIDHPDSTVEDVKSFGVTVTVADPQGAEDTAILTIGIEDDMPVVSDTTFSVAEDDGDTGIITITPAAFGADGPAETDTVTVIDDVDRGTLTYDPDTGTFSYDPGDAFNDLGPGETAEVSFTYQVTDADSDTDTATVTITVNGDNDPPVINENPQVSDLSSRVSEEGLDNGIVDTAPDATLDTTDSTTASGQIVFTDPDASDAGNHIVTLGAPVEPLASGGTPIFWTGSGSSNLVGYAGEGGPEVISITIDNAGNYNVIFSAPIDHADATIEDVKSFGVTVTVADPQGAEDTAILTIGIEDDMPVVSDTTFSVAEDDGDTGIITFTPAAFGADGPAETDTVIVIDDVDRGTLTYDPDTGTFSYDPGDAFNDLGAGETAEVSFTYQVTDADSDTDTAMVTITVNGDNDPPVINENPQVSDLSARVSEEGLDNGLVDTAPDATLDTTDSTTASGQIVFSDPDAGDAGNHLVTLGAPVEPLASGGTPIFWTGSGSSNLVGYAGEGGPEVISITIDNAGNYNVIFSAPIDHPDSTVEDVKSFGVTVTVADPQGAEDTATLTIGIEDDMPVVSDTTFSVAEDDGDTGIITITPAAFGADGPAETDTVTVIDNVDRGTLTYDPDTGTFSYDPGDAFNDLGPGETAEVSFTYQVTDADSDTDTATVTITVNGDNDPPVINENPQVSDLSSRVSEEGLDNGIVDTAPDATLDTTDSTTASGQIVFTDPDASDAGNHIVTLGAPVEPLASGGTPIFWTGSGSSNLVGYAGEGGPEVISITIDNAGNYNVIFSAPIDHPDSTVEDVKSFGVTVTVADPQGAEDTATLTIGIEDDMPVVSDTTFSVAEDDGDTGIITITPAAFGADGPAETDTVTVIDDVDRGTLTYDPDTGTFSYDPGDAFNDLGAGETGEVSFTYQVTDADSDTDTATVTITVNGDNDPPVINENPQVSDLSSRISEEGLDNGIVDTAPDATLDTTDSTTASGQIVFTDPDAGDAGNHIVTLGAPVEPLASGGTPIFWTGSGSSNLVGYAGEGGPEVISITIDNAGNYNVIFSAPIDHPDSTVEDVKSFGVTVTVADPQGAEDTATLTIGIEDDSPTFTNIDNGIIANEPGILIGTHDISFGADQPGSLNVTPLTNIDGVNYGDPAYTSDGSVELTASTISGDFFTLTVNTDGTYYFDLINDRPAVQQQFSLLNVTGGGRVSSFDLGDATFNAVDFNDNGSIGNEEKLNSTSVGFGVGSGNLDTGEQFTIDFSDGIFVDSLTFHAKHEGSKPFVLQWSTDTGETDTISITADSSIIIDPLSDFSSIDFNILGGKAKFDNFSYNKLLLADDESLQFNIQATDADNDMASQTLSITLLGEEPAGNLIEGTSGNDAVKGTSSSETIEGHEGDDYLQGGDGDDTLTGGDGADTFKVAEGDDTITDYNATEDDIVDISDMFESVDSLAVSENPDGTVKLSVLDGNLDEKGSVSFENIEFASLDSDPGVDLNGDGDMNELDSLLGQVDVDDGIV